MAEFYSKNDIKRRIIKWAGKCADVKAKNVGESFTDMSPACLGLAPKDSELERVLAVLNPVKSSYRVFNEIHITATDTFLTVGCGHFTYDNVTSLFLEMPDDAWLEFRTYVAELLLASPNYLEQFSQDYVVKKFLGSKNPSELKKADVLAASLEFFFGRDLLKKQSVDAAKKAPELTTRYQHIKGESWTIVGKEKNYLNLWADTVLLLAIINPNTQKPPQQYDVYTDYSDDRAKIGCTKFVNTVQDTQSSPVCVRLFPGHENSNGDCGFWFYNVLYKALLIKSVANWQHQLWIREFYNEAKQYCRTLGADDVSILAGLIAWKSNGLTKTVASKISYKNVPAGDVVRWRNLGNMYYLRAAEDVLVNQKQDPKFKKQELFNECLRTHKQLFTGLVIWTTYNMYKGGRMRNRQRAMWCFFSDHFGPGPFKTEDLKKVALDVTEEAVTLIITLKSGAVHKFTIISK
jgi:hypothetical protein